MGNINSKLPQQITDLLIKIRKTTQESISVAELGQVVNIDLTATVGKYQCELLTTANVSVRCECLQGVNPTVGTRVLIVFCDTDYRPSLMKIRSGNRSAASKQADLHSTSYGVIVGLID